MKKARIVIGANYGDEGKGLVTDYLCSLGASMCVRFNGGAQAGHTVVTPEGVRHVFKHLGAGTFCGVPTFLSQFFVCNPIIFESEVKRLPSGTPTRIYAHPACPVTTFADMIINQWKETQKGAKRHGSVGMGVNETVNRSSIEHLKITMGDLWNNPRGIEERLREICTTYATFRTGKDLQQLIQESGEHAEVDAMIELYIEGCEWFAQQVHPLGIDQCGDNVVFEGAQGLLLDQNNRKDFPHLTRSNTGMQNAKRLCDMANIEDIEAYYVSRTYLTRHGAGPLPDEDREMQFEDDTNVTHPFQGALRFAPLDAASMVQRCTEDFMGVAKVMHNSLFRIVLTHCDQLPPLFSSDVLACAWGPTRTDVDMSGTTARLPKREGV